jgi:hypothetical protein
MVKMNLTALSIYGRRITDSLKAAESELNRHCSCPPGEACKVEIHELPNRRFEALVVRPRPLAQPTDWMSMPAVKGMYRMTFEKRATAEDIREAIAEIVAAPLAENADADVEPLTEVHVVFFSLEMLYEATKLIVGCEACNPLAEIPFERVLDRVSGHHSAVRRYILMSSVKCPSCCGRVTPNTLIKM